MKQPLRRGLRVANVFFSLVCALLVVAVLLPRISYLGPLGSLVVPMYAPWFITLPFVVEALVLWRSPVDCRRNAWLLFSLALFTMAGSSVVLLRMLHTARSNAVKINGTSLFKLHGLKGAGPDETLQYDRDEAGPLLIGVYRPQRSQSGDLAPILIDVHGGGWIMGTMLDHDRDLRAFADRGWLVFTPNYTLSSAAIHQWNGTTSQVACAMSWVAAHAGSFGGDAASISMIGDSAGGNLAINAAYASNHGTLTSDCGGSIPYISTVIVTYPVVDPAAFYQSKDALLAGFARKMAGEYTGGSPEQFPERYAAINSTTNLNRDAPPTLIIVGESDHLVPPGPTYDFAARAQSEGVDMHIIRVPYADHGFDGAVGSIGNQLVREATLRFLIAHKRKP